MDNYTLADFERFCAGLQLDIGTAFELYGGQRTMLAEHFEGATEAVVILPKKNGKTTLLAALALYHLGFWPDAECVIGASSRDQATILFNQAAGLVRRSGAEGVFDVKTGYREIRLRASPGARIRVLAADASTADGVIPTLALVDELHRHPSGDLYGVFRDGLGPRDGRMVTISTAGSDVESPLGVLRGRAHELPTFERKGAYNHATSNDGSFVLHEWCLNDTDDLHDMQLVKEANPAPWHTLAALRQRHDSPSMTPSQWARFACGVWTSGENYWIEPKDWDQLERDEIADGEEVWLAVSGASSAAVVATARRFDGVAVKAWALDAQPGTRVYLEQVETLIVGLAERYIVQDVYYDRVYFQRSAELLSERGLPLMEVPDSPERLSIVSTSLYRLITAGQLRHDGDPRLRAQIIAGKTKETERGWRLMKDENTHALIALAKAAHQATETVAEAPAFVAF